MYLKTKILSTVSIIGAALLLGALAAATTTTTILTTSNQVFAQQENQTGVQGDLLVIQNTSASKQDPVPGHEMHQLVLVAPPRQDGKIWSGVVTFTASKAVDVVVLHPYNKPRTVNQTVGEPLNAPNPFAPGQNIAITLMTKQTDRPVFFRLITICRDSISFSYNYRRTIYSDIYT